jgi:serine/threonine-protein kinase
VEPDDDLIGRSLGSYTIVKALGKGGMGAVFMAEHPVIGSRVAIKFLHPQYSADKKIVDRFFNEARAVNLIGHDNILKIVDLNVTEDNRHYFIMEFLHGRPLQDLVEPDKPLALELVGPILLQCCEALQAAHERGIVHRDLKPDNVYLIVHKGRKNFVKLVDFGIAKLTDVSGQSTGKTQTGMVMGTPAYMSPEQAGGQTNRIDARSDIYSLGVMMFQMATGKLPFPGQSFGEVLIGHLQLPPPRPRELVTDIPEPYEAILLKCLEKKQDDRYRSMRELGEAIRGCMDQLGLSAELPWAAPSDLPPVISSSNPGGIASNKLTPTRKLTPRPPSQPGARSRPEQSPAATTPPAKSYTALIAAGAVVVVALLGTAAYLVQDSNRRALEAAQRAAEVAATKAKEQADRQVQAAKEGAREGAPSVFLSVVSDPLGADVQAAWKDGHKAGATPFSFDVAKNSKVRFEFRKVGYLPYAMEIVADSPQTVSGKLMAEPRVLASSPVAPRKKPKSDKPPAAPKPDEDGTIKIDF